MKILIATPLYPPDIKEPAPYVKELAKRLSPTHTVIILAYNHIPERIDGVTIITVEKSANVLVRLFRFFQSLRRHMASVDVLYVQNGPSVELPVLMSLSLATRTPKTILRLGDSVPLTKGDRSFASRITNALMKRVAVTFSHEDTCALCEVPTTVISRPLPRPEILPFPAQNAHSEKEYEDSWNEHVNALLKIFIS
jgi:hypothetical protein